MADDADKPGHATDPKPVLHPAHPRQWSEPASPAAAGTYVGLDAIRISPALPGTSFAGWQQTNFPGITDLTVIETLDLDPPTDPAYPLIKARVSKGPDPVKLLRLRIVK